MLFRYLIAILGMVQKGSVLLSFLLLSCSLNLQGNYRHIDAELQPEVIESPDWIEVDLVSEMIDLFPETNEDSLEIEPSCREDDDCDDGLYCTTEDRCDGRGNCMGSGNACDDRVTCTWNGCSEGIDGPVCDYSILPGYCLIEERCYSNEEGNPDDECKICRSTLSNDSWSLKNDMTSCTDGVCCGGECRTGGNCCATSDCLSGCYGTASLCDTFITESTCEHQGGCLWITGSTYCSGRRSCSDIFVIDITDCIYPCGCSAANPTAGGWICVDGPPIPCSGFSEEETCSLCACSWNERGGCIGMPHPCFAYLIEAACNSQSDCTWSEGNCVDYTCQ